MNQIKAMLQGRWAMMLLYGSQEIYASASGIEPDGRKQKAALRALTEEGYIVAEPVSGGGEKLRITSKAFDELEAVKPVLGFKVDAEKSRHNVRCIHGAAWESLKPAEQKYVLAHPAEFTFVEAQHHAQPEEAITLDAWRAAGAKPDGYSRRTDKLFVQDEDFKTRRQQRLFDLRVEEAQAKNLGWGLRAQGLASAVDSEFFKQEDMSLSFGGSWDPKFGTDPSKWGEDLDKQIEVMTERMQHYRAKVEVLVETKAKIEKAGGWEKFRQQYRADIEREVRQQGKGDD